MQAIQHLHQRPVLGQFSMSLMNELPVPVYAVAGNTFGGIYGGDNLSIIGQPAYPGSDCPCYIPAGALTMHLVGTGPYVVASSDFAVSQQGWMASSIHGLNDILPTAISGTATFHDPGNNYPDETWDFATDLWTNLQTLSYDAATTTWTERVPGPNWYSLPSVLRHCPQRRGPGEDDAR